MKELLARVIVGCAVVVVAVISVCWVIGGDLTEAVHSDVGRPPPDLEASNITLASAAGPLIHGWLSRGPAGQGVILLLHGMRADRRAMLPRAEYLRAQGYTVLLIDMQAHGESRGERITFGDRESGDAAAAIHYLHHMFPAERIGVIGVSLGAAAFVLGDGRPPVAAVVLDSMYPTVDQYVADRLRAHVGPLGLLFAPVLMMQMRPRLQMDPLRMRPIDRMARIGAPVLIADGLWHAHSANSEGRELYDAASEPKELWEVPGAAQQDLHAFAKDQYERRVGDFLRRYLRDAATGPHARPES